LGAGARPRHDPARRDRARGDRARGARGARAGRRRLTVTAAYVVEILEALAPLEPRLDGGWGIDALLGEQTREHEDVDAVIARADAYEARELLRPLDFSHDTSVVPGLPARLVLRDGRRRQVDLHLIVRDTAGNGWQQLDDGTWGRYDAAGLAATGVVGSRRVACISPELQLRHHRGYDWSPKDRADMTLLAERFGLLL
jgi:lincosamide nucleotidyltransferase A/C/D/E